MARRFDPERRDRIIDATIESIGEHGVAGTSHRRVAERAGVPLGSMTYHFAGMDELLMEAFDRFTRSIASIFEQRMLEADDPQQALAIIVDLIHDDLQRSNREHVLSYELYTLAARRAEFRVLTQRWMQASRRALERHFDPDTARRLDAYIEGAALHIALEPSPQDRSTTATALAALARIGTR